MHKLVFCLVLAGWLLDARRAGAVPTQDTFGELFDDAGDPPGEVLASVRFVLEFQTQDRCGYMMAASNGSGLTTCTVHEEMTFGNELCATNASESLDTIVMRAPGPDCSLLWNDNQVYKVKMLFLGENRRTGDLAGLVQLEGPGGYIRGLRLAPRATRGAYGRAEPTAPREGTALESWAANEPPTGLLPR